MAKNLACALSVADGAIVVVVQKSSSMHSGCIGIGSDAVEGCRTYNVRRTLDPITNI